MIYDILEIFKYVFQCCVAWTTALFDSVGAGPVVISAFIVCLIVSMFLIPLRGNSVVSDALADFSAQSTYRGKYTPNTRRRSASSYGIFERRKGFRTNRLQRVRLEKGQIKGVDY